MAGLKWILAALAGLAAPPAHAAELAGDCELHVWTTSNFGAVFHGGNAGWSGYGATVSTYLSPLEETKGAVAAGLPEHGQQMIVEGLSAAMRGRLAGYRLVFHAMSPGSRGTRWGHKDAGVGGRDAASGSPCYAELHIGFITLFRQALSKKLQTGFVYREFGASAQVERWAQDASSTGTPGFPTSDPAKREQARASLQAAFRSNVEAFLRKKKIAGAGPREDSH
jgi:hypothetical protein